jgi:glucan biosynthesis protein
MKSLKNIMMTIVLLLSVVIGHAQIKNSKTETIKITGNCGMCKSNIEKAGSVKKVAKVVWNEETKMATITYNPQKTNVEEILKRIALAGYDSAKFQATDDAYNNLHGCCQYDRDFKAAPSK